MKPVMLHRRGQALLERELYLRERFLLVAQKETTWTPVRSDNAAAYVGLLHAEAEALLEYSTEQLLAQGLAAIDHSHCHPVLLNALLYYGAEAQQKLQVAVIPSKSQLMSNPVHVAWAWRESGAAEFWAKRIKNNHGTGEKYIEQLLHPLGVQLNAKTFEKSAGNRGVERLVTLPPSLATDLRELVSLRGRAMHDRASRIQLGVRETTNLSQMIQSGSAAAQAIATVAGKISLLW
ncbi:hypothetical protein [Curtobacterium sp. MCPF17_046]|uniref:hypothetical protein n=1 Tax=Curtobacterium sp. MCPF17_046 TaxID=2175663 RepID=UPI0011B4B578|nr:hypothetical protein [Curtobacterium sp. MCPF17_046]